MNSDDRETLEMALVGFQSLIADATKRADAIRQQLAGTKRQASTELFPELPPELRAKGPRRKLSTAARKRISEAQRKRWKEYHKQEKAMYA